MFAQQFLPNAAPAKGSLFCYGLKAKLSIPDTCVNKKAKISFIEMESVFCIFPLGISQEVVSFGAASRRRGIEDFF